MIDDANTRALEGRKKRLRWLLSNESQESYAAPHLAWLYYEEARLCWYVGAFVPAVVMSQMALEELLRSQYRAAKGVGGRLQSKKETERRPKEVDRAGFKDLIREAEADGWIRPREAELLDDLRALIRNPYVHPKDYPKGWGKMRESASEEEILMQPGFFFQSVKIEHGEVENEARKAMEILIVLFPAVSKRI